MPFKIILAITLSFIATYAFLVFPGNEFITPYVFQKHQKISIQAFVDYLASRVMYAVLMICFSMMIDKFYPAFSREMNIVVWLFCLYIIDYWLFYHNPLVKIYGIPISYPLVMGIILIVLSVTTFIKWNYLK